jgi:UDP-3-O-[3-hydroxymyristoyl] glucosamine N-acyltransferase
MNQIHPTAVIAECVVLGDNIKIGPNCSVGYDGFEFHRDSECMPAYQDHEGGVILEDGVELQAGVCIARGYKKGDDTILHRNVKVDNLVHIAHGCEIGEGTLLTAGVILGGHVRIGKHNFLGLNCTVKNSHSIGDYNLIGMSSVVICDIPSHEVWAGVPARKLRDNKMFKDIEYETYRNDMLDCLFRGE